MKQNPEYIRNLLKTLQDCPSPWPTTGYLESAGVEPDGEMLFHFQLLDDNGFIIPVESDHNFGFKLRAGDSVDWSDVDMRLTAKGHEFIEALDSEDIWDFIKSHMRNASLRTIFDIARHLVDGYARKTIETYAGNIKIKT